MPAAMSCGSALCAKVSDNNSRSAARRVPTSMASRAGLQDRITDDPPCCKYRPDHSDGARAALESAMALARPGALAFLLILACAGSAAAAEVLRRATVWDLKLGAA